VGAEVVDLGVFSRQWAIEGRRVAWFLGAGASAAASVPTASQIVMDLLARMFADVHGLILQDLNLGDPGQRERIVAYYDNMNGMPPAGAPSDYSTAFKLALPNDGTRRQYLRGLLKDRSPSYGQRVLGAFLAQGLADLVLTTNFDDLVEQAADQARASVEPPLRPRLGVASLGDSGRAGLALSDDDFPLLVKLHGDFREMELRNLDAELREQNERLRQSFLDSSRRFGLAVIGYSGRDASVMDMITKAIRTPGALPAGLWWLTREPESVLPAVADLMQSAAAAGVLARFVKIENFDETLGSLGRQAMLDSALRTHIDNLRAQPRVIDVALPTLDKGALPVLRLNALPILDAPKRALRTTLREPAEPRSLQQTLQDSRWRGVLASSGQQVIAFGSISHLSQVLDLATSPVEVPIDCISQDATSTERGLAYEALTRALARRLPTRALVRERGHRLIMRPINRERPDTADQAAARKILQEAYDAPLTGSCPRNLGRGRDGKDRVYAEAVRLSIEWRLGVLWLLFVPHTWVSPTEDQIDTRHGIGDPAAAWRKERWVNRRNEKWAAIIAAWAKVMAPEERTTLPVLPEGLAGRDLTGGQFVLSKTTAYSRVAR